MKFLYIQVNLFSKIYFQELKVIVVYNNFPRIIVHGSQVMVEEGVVNSEQ